MLYDLSIYNDVIHTEDKNVENKIRCYHNFIYSKLFCMLGILSSKLVFFVFEYIISSISLWSWKKLKYIFIHWNLSCKIFRYCGKNSISPLCKNLEIFVCLWFNKIGEVELEIYSLSTTWFIYCAAIKPISSSVSLVLWLYVDIIFKVESHNKEGERKSMWLHHRHRMAWNISLSWVAYKRIKTFRSMKTQT